MVNLAKGKSWRYKVKYGNAGWYNCRKSKISIRRKTCWTEIKKDSIHWTKRIFGKTWNGQSGIHGPSTLLFETVSYLWLKSPLKWRTWSFRRRFLKIIGIAAKNCQGMTSYLSPTKGSSDPKNGPLRIEKILKSLKSLKIHYYSWLVSKKKMNWDSKLFRRK